MSLWPGSFESALELSKKTVKEYSLYLSLTFICGFALNLMVESPFAAPLTATDDTARIISQLILMTWSLIEGFLLFMFSTWIPVPASLMEKQIHSPWDKDTWISLTSESLRALGWVILWTLAFILPGIIQYILLSFVPYVVVFAKDYRAGEVDALQISRAMIKPIFFPMAGLSIALSLCASAFELAPQMAEVLGFIPVRLILELCGFLISVYGYSLIRILFHKSLIAYYNGQNAGKIGVQT